MKRILLSLLASGVCAGAMAIPAYPGFVAFTQPDGTVINIKMVGDEHAHMVYTEGGMLLVNVDGGYEYAKFDEEGFPLGSGILAKPDNEVMARKLKLQPTEKLDKWTEKINAERILSLNEMGSKRRIATRSEEEGENDGVVPSNFGRWDVDFPLFGDQKGLVVLVEFEDVAFEHSDLDYFQRMLNQEGFSDYGAVGSARDWFISNSNGQFRPEFDVYGPVKLPNDRRYYGRNDYRGRDPRAYEMIIDACQLLDEEVDFSQYDRDGNGFIDNVFVFYAGEGEHESGIADAVWPHSWDIVSAKPDEKYIFDGVRLNDYACSCEYFSRYGRVDGFGTFVHEFSHVMGLPDLYATVINFSVPFSPGSWSVMDSGSYNNEGLTPCNYSSFEKCALGWLDFKPLTEGVIEIPELASSNVAYALPTEKPEEFYFFENRQQVGNDQFLPGHGMVAWHVYYIQDVWERNVINNIDLRQYVDLIEADNEKSDETRDGDSFPGAANVTSFGFKTTPRLGSWNKKQLAFDIEDIAESEDGIITIKTVAPTNVPDAVDEVATENAQNDVYFDLMGRRVTTPNKGIYIRNGKKVIL